MCRDKKRAFSCGCRRCPSAIGPDYEFSSRVPLPKAAATAFRINERRRFNRLTLPREVLYRAPRNHHKSPRDGPERAGRRNRLSAAVSGSDGTGKRDSRRPSAADGPVPSVSLVQTSFNRCFRNGWQGGVNWTLSLRHKGNTFSPKHLQHNADGTICLRPEQDAVDDVLSYNNPAAATTITNNQFNADGSVNTARLSPATAGAGAATGAQAMRSVQMQIRFTF